MTVEFILLPNDNGALLYSYNYNRKVPRSVQCKWFLSSMAMQKMDLNMCNCPKGIKVLSAGDSEKSQITQKSRIGIMQLRKKMRMTNTDILVVDCADSLFIYGSSDERIDKWEKRSIFDTTIESLSKKLIEIYGLKGYIVPDFYKPDLELFVYELLTHSSVPLSRFYAPIFAKKEKYLYGSIGDENSVECIVKDTEIILPFLWKSLMDQINPSLKNYTSFVVISPSYYLTKCFQDITSYHNNQ